MSVEVRIPSDIDSYKEKIVAGLSLRQIICVAVALVTAAPTFFLLRNINEDFALYVTMLVATPAVCIGFIKKDGYTFEQLIKIKFNTFFNKQTRGYVIYLEENLIPYEIEEFRKYAEEEKERKLIEEVERIKRGEKINVPVKKQKTKRAKSENRKEYSRVEISTKEIKRKRKAAYKTITATRKRN